MGYMFYDASSANPDVSGWDVSQVTSMRYMFQGVSLANPDMSMWDFNSVIDMSGMFKNVVLSIRNYTAMLNRIHQTSEQSNVVLGGGNSKYSHRAQEAREMLEARGWIIDDGGKTEVSIPKVTSVAIISTPRVGDTYGRDEYIEVSVTFSEVVKLSGGLKLLSLFISGSWRGARYIKGSGSEALIFSYKVQADDRDSNGVTIAWSNASGSEGLVGSGTIISYSTGEPANLGYSEQSNVSDHKVDGSLNN